MGLGARGPCSGRAANANFAPNNIGASQQWHARYALRSTVGIGRVQPVAETWSRVLGDASSLLWASLMRQEWPFYFGCGRNSRAKYSVDTLARLIPRSHRQSRAFSLSSGPVRARARRTVQAAEYARCNLDDCARWLREPRPDRQQSFRRVFVPFGCAAGYHRSGR